MSIHLTGTARAAFNRIARNILAALAAATAAAGIASADTLASWTLKEKRASTSPVPVADVKGDSIANANLALGNGVVGANYADSFMGCNYNKTSPSFERAISDNEYLEVYFETASRYINTLDSLTYSIRRYDKSPTNFRWICVTNDASMFALDNGPTEVTATGTGTERTLSLSSLEIPPNTSVSLRLVPWGSTSDSKSVYFGFSGTVTLSGTATEVEVTELTLDEIDDFSIDYGATTNITIGVAGNDGDVSFGLSADKVVSGTAEIVNGVFSYTPSLGDVKLSPITFTVNASTGTQSTNETFTVTVNPPSVAAREGTSLDAYIGQPLAVHFDFIGDVGDGVATNCACTSDDSPTDSANWSYADGVLTYTPTDADDETTQKFKITLTVGENDYDCEVTVAVSVEPVTLVTWLINSNATAETPYGVTYENPSPVDTANTATLTLGPGVTPYSQGSTFGGNYFEYNSQGSTTYDDAVAAGDYFEISFKAASNYRITPKYLTYTIRRTASGPRYGKWVFVSSDETQTPIGDAILDFSETIDAAGMLCVQQLDVGALDKGEAAALRLYVWGATASANGRFYFNTPRIVLSGVATLDEEAYVAPSIDVVSGATADCYVGDTNEVVFAFAGDTGTRVSVASTNVTADAEITGYTSLEGNTFVYSPSAADATLGAVTFTATLTATDSQTGEHGDTASFTVRVWDKPDFLETFNSVSMGSSFAVEETTIHGDAANWTGTNFLVRTSASDPAVSGKSACMRGNAGHLEMTTAKNSGAGYVALSHGVYGNDAGTATIRLYIARKVGSAWSDWGEPVATISLSNENRALSRTRTEDLNYEGLVKLRIEYESTMRFNIDDVAIGDYGEPVEDDEEEVLWLSLASDGVLREAFNGIGTAESAELPAPWRVASTNVVFCTNGLDYASADNSTTKRALNKDGKMSAMSNAGIYNLGTNAADRAVGFVSSEKFKTCALMVPLKNIGSLPLASFRVSYNVEKWKNGRGKTIALCTSTDGVEWREIGGAFTTATETDYSDDEKTVEDYSVISVGDDPRLKNVSGKVVLEEPTAAGGTIYLGWFYTSGDGGVSRAQCLGIDDVEIWVTKRTVFSLQ